MSYKDTIGRAGWKYLHTFAEGYDKIDDPNKIETFFKYFADTFPCGKCRVHFKEYIRINRPIFKTGKEMRQYLCRFHNKVNWRLGKPLYNCKKIN